MKTSPCAGGEARFRLEQAQGHLHQARAAADKRVGTAWTNVAASDAVLAGVASADAIACARVGRRAAGDSHQEAVDHLRTALPPDRRRLATTLGRLLAVKTPAQYGGRALSASRARAAVDHATKLVEAAEALVA